jgi:fermentation-respiration switch protein FrsA (DUF1100 family)
MTKTISVKQISLLVFALVIIGSLIVIINSLNVQRPDTSEKTEKVSEKVNRRAVTFPSEGETLRGWLYFPANIKPGRKLPGIVTANALSGIKEINLPQYAERFAAAGFVTVIFDYRYWGESSGEPRFHVAPMEFRTDTSAALTFLAQQPEVDPNRIGGWGISMGGQNMLFLATWELRFNAIVATSTGISNPTQEAPLSPEAAMAKYDQLAAAAKTERRARAGIKTMQAWCPQPAEGCVLPVKEAYDFYETARKTIAPEFENKMTSTSFQNLIDDDSTFAIHLAKAPILIVHPDRDVVSVDNVLFYFKRAPEPKRLVVPGGLHTSTYVNGSNLEMAAFEAIAWFKKYLSEE